MFLRKKIFENEIQIGYLQVMLEGQNIHFRNQDEILQNKTIQLQNELEEFREKYFEQKSAKRLETNLEIDNGFIYNNNDD